MKQIFKNSHIRDNVYKNIIILAIAIIFYPIIHKSLSGIKVEEVGNFLLVISMLSVMICFANFAFTYEKSKLETKAGKIISHLSTGVFMLVMALLLETTMASFKIIYPSFHTLIVLFSMLTYTGIVLYDFWDLMRHSN